jgi:hypothetical protein
VTVTLVVVLAEEKNGEIQDERSGKSATITLHSAFAASSVRPEIEHYIIMRGPKANVQESKPQENKTQEKPRIDWNGVPPVIACAPLWMPAFLSKKEDDELSPQRPAEITGLRFPMDPLDHGEGQ